VSETNWRLAVFEGSLKAKKNELMSSVNKKAWLEVDLTRTMRVTVDETRLGLFPA